MLCLASQLLFCHFQPFSGQVIERFAPIQPVTSHVSNSLYVKQAIWREAEKISGSSWDLNPGPFDF